MQAGSLNRLSKMPLSCLFQRQFCNAHWYSGVDMDFDFPSCLIV